MKAREGRKRFSIAVVILVILNVVAVGVLIFLFVTRWGESINVPTTWEEEKQLYFNESLDKANNGSYQDSLNYLQEKADKIDEKDKRDELLILQISALISLNKFDEAADKIESMDPEPMSYNNQQSFYILAQSVYFHNGDIDKANQYEEKINLKPIITDEGFVEGCKECAE